MPASRARRLCPQAIFLPPDFPTYREASAQVMGIVRAHVERVEVVGLDEAYLDLDGPVLAARGDAPAGGRDQGGHGADLLGGDRPQQARGQGRLRRGEAGRLRGAHPRAGVRALRRLAAGPRAGDRPEDGRAPRRARADARSRGSPTAPEQLLSSASAPTSGASWAGARASNTTARSGAARKVVSESRERTFDNDISDPARAARGARADGRGAVREPRARTAAGVARSGSRCASTTSPRSRARARSPRPRATPRSSQRRRLRLLEDYAPPRPVRLLGVRVAGLSRAARGRAREQPSGEEAARARQLAAARVERTHARIERCR